MTNGAAAFLASPVTRQINLDQKFRSYKR